MAETYYAAINWNEIEDIIDKSTWEKLTEQFWLDTRIPLSNDLDDWRGLSELEKTTVAGGLFEGRTYASQRPAAPQGRMRPLSVTGRPISSERTEPPFKGTISVPIR